MQLIVTAYNHLINILKSLSGVVIFVAFLLIVIDVFVRLVGLSPSTYTIGIVEYGLLWFTMLAAPWLVRVKGHVFIDALTQLLSPRPKRVLAKIVYTICICSSLIFFYVSFDLFIQAVESGEIEIRGEDMPLWSLLLPMPVCFLLVAIEFGRYLIGLDTMYGDRTDVKDSV